MARAKGWMAGILILAGSAGMGSAEPLVPPQVYTAAQAASGKNLYQNKCAQCHLDNLDGVHGNLKEIPPALKAMGGKSPPLAGARFLDKWGPMTTRDLLNRIKMVEKMDDERYINLVSYIMQYNGAPSGTEPMTASTEVAIQSITKPADNKQ